MNLSDRWVVLYAMLAGVLLEIALVRVTQGLVAGDRLCLLFGVLSLWVGVANAEIAMTALRKRRANETANENDR